MRVCVVGAGPAGLCAAKHSLQHGMEVTVFEQSGDIGGTWRYTDCTDRDEHGAPVHTSMYRDLRTNLPKEIMFFPGYPHKETGESYITSEEVLEYINGYADANKLRSLCRFHNQVKMISRDNDAWSVSVVEFPSTEERMYSFDVIFICNGINQKPFTPEFEGSHLFEGCSMHSHEFRTAEPFSGQTVLIVGGGPSALDISDHVSRRASKVFISHYSTLLPTSCLDFSNNVILKPVVKQFFMKEVEFSDSTVQRIDAVIYCTGFRCTYPFLDVSCEMTEDDGYIFPLYKYFINANQPTMCILGNLSPVAQFPTFDFQVRFFIKSLLTNILPNKGEMISEIENVLIKTQEKGRPKRKAFKISLSEDIQYYDQLAAMANIESMPKVILKMVSRASFKAFTNFPRMRKDRYTILDCENFTVTNV